MKRTKTPKVYYGLLRKAKNITYYEAPMKGEIYKTLRPIPQNKYRPVVFDPVSLKFKSVLKKDIYKKPGVIFVDKHDSIPLP